MENRHGYSSKALDLLNSCDMHTIEDGKDGEDVAFESRLKEIRNRLGENSKDYINSKKINSSIKNLDLLLN